LKLSHTKKTQPSVHGLETNPEFIVSVRNPSWNLTSPIDISVSERKTQLQLQTRVGSAIQNTYHNDIHNHNTISFSPDDGTQHLIYNQFPSDSNFHPKSANLSDQSKQTCGVILLLSNIF
jgi:hypothetical protein